jgi:NAD(P)-dependent dehydrogenase (short-subunit alcohol dehydrogenase family)
MKTIVISGGNSGIGLEAARQLVGKGHRVVLLGRDAEKGKRAVEMLGEQATFLPSDLSTHAGVRAAAEAILAQHPRIDALLQGAGVLTTDDKRTADDLHVVFAVNYLSRYHLAERLLPSLRAAKGAIVLLVAPVSLKTKIDFDVFPRFKPFRGLRSLPSVQIANYYFVAHLAKAAPEVRAAAVNVGLVQTEIMRAMPGFMRFMFSTVGRLASIPVERSAQNAVELCLSDDWASGVYLPKPGKRDVVTPLEFDPAIVDRVVAASRELTGV